MIEFETEATEATVATEELYHTNLLRLQATELLSESILGLSSHTGELDKEVKWAGQVRDYLDSITDILGKMGSCVLSPDITLMSFTGHDNNGTSSHDDQSNDRRFWIRLQSDKAHKHFTKNKKWEIPFPGGSKLKVAPINSYEANGAGLTTLLANANVIPTIDLAVLMPAYDQSYDDYTTATDAMIGGKDYLNGRYFDKRNILAIHVAKYLSQKKQRKSIGSVHVRYDLDGDFRKISLILTPPIDYLSTSQNEEHSNRTHHSKKKQKRSNGAETPSSLEAETQSKKDKKNKKLRFRVRLVFGTQLNHNATNLNTGWLPSARLFPNRSNNKLLTDSATSTKLQHGSNSNNSLVPTPTYNNGLASDLHHINTTQILSNTAQRTGKAFTESWTLLKIWCLQRGFVRGHDTFSENNLGLILAYLYRTRMISVRMECIQIFNVAMKFMAETDWLGDGSRNNTARRGQLGGEEGAGKDTIRFSHSQAYQDSTLSIDRRKKAAMVMPELDMTEKQTILKCAQNRLYASDYKESVSARKMKGKSPLVDDDDNEEHPQTLLESYKKYSEGPVFLDPTMTVNYFGHLSPSFVAELQVEARRALKCIHCHSFDENDLSSDGKMSAFQQLFLEHIRFWRRFDEYVRIDLNQIRNPTNQHYNKESEKPIWGTDVCDVGDYESISRGLVRVLRAALGDRITALRLLSAGNGETSNISVYNDKLTSGDVGVRSWIDSDENFAVPIRGSLDKKSSFNGFESGAIISPVTHSNRQGESLVIGLRIDPDTCQRIVDRGPPADDTAATAAFISLWGKDKAQLRRFKDGAIVHAVLWNTIDNDATNGQIQFEGGDKMGGIVERIVRHITTLHFSEKQRSNNNKSVQFSCREMMSLIDGVALSSNSEDRLMGNSTALHKDIMSAFDSLSKILRQSSSKLATSSVSKEVASKLGLPLSIDAVEALSPCLRYAELFPPTPHPLLGAKGRNGNNKLSGAIIGDPILIQIRFEVSSKWPADVNAMGAAKCAMLLQLAEGIGKLKKDGDRDFASFDGPINVTTSYLELGYLGYVWRILIRADQELKMLRALRNPSADAITLQQALMKRHVIASVHHFVIHAVHTKYPSAAAVVRLAKRWIAVHMLSNLIPHEAIELLVASIYTNPAPLHIPSTLTSGFMRFLSLLAHHDWDRKPLVVDPHGNISLEERARISSQFESVRTSTYQNGPAMYIVSPNDREEEREKLDLVQAHECLWTPIFTNSNPERVVLSRARSLAKRSYQHLMKVFSGCESVSSMSVFQETPSALRSYSLLLRVDPQLVIDSGCSSTAGDGSLSSNLLEGGTPYNRSMQKRYFGPKELRRKIYKNLNSSNTENELLYSWRPIDSVVARLQSRFGHIAVLFYNSLAPEIIAILWRPSVFVSQPFTAINSECKEPIEKHWTSDSLVATNINDILREIGFMVQEIVVDIKILKNKVHCENVKKRKTAEGINSDDKERN